METIFQKGTLFSLKGRETEGIFFQ